MSDPTRAEVEARWRDILSGSRSREEVHDWTKPWVEGNDSASDPLVSIGLTQLHGFDLTATPAEPGLVRHGITPGRIYLRSDADIADELRIWQLDAGLFDSDPAAWERRKWLRIIGAERDARGVEVARRYADRAVALGHLDEDDAAQALEADGPQEGATAAPVGRVTAFA